MTAFGGTLFHIVEIGLTASQNASPAKGVTDATRTA